MLRGVQHDRTSAFDARTSTSSTTCGCATLRRQSASQRMSPLVAERLNGRCIASTRCPSRPVGHGSSREDHAAETPFAERLQNPGPFHPGGHPGGHGPRGSPAPPRRQVRAPSPWRTMTRAGASGARERQGRRGNAQQSVETLVTGAWRLGHPPARMLSSTRADATVAMVDPARRKMTTTRRSGRGGGGGGEEGGGGEGGGRGGGLGGSQPSP